MPDLIRYALSDSSLGTFIAAMSSSGLVTFEFYDDETEALNLLGARFPDATVERDDAGLREIVDKLKHAVDHPAEGTNLKLDPPGGPYQRQVWALLREIPVGETTTYGALAAKLGTRDARDVTQAIGANPIAVLIPCHRVVKKDGGASGIAGACAGSVRC